MGGYSQVTVRVPHTVHTYSAWHGIYIHEVPVRTYLLLVLYCSATFTPVRYYFTVRIPIPTPYSLLPYHSQGVGCWLLREGWRRIKMTNTFFCEKKKKKRRRSENVLYVLYCTVCSILYCTNCPQTELVWDLYCSTTERTADC
jgi:hypothetical protein